MIKRLDSEVAWDVFSALYLWSYWHFCRLVVKRFPFQLNSILFLIHMITIQKIRKRSIKSPYIYLMQLFSVCRGTLNQNCFLRFLKYGTWIRNLTIRLISRGFSCKSATLFSESPTIWASKLVCLPVVEMFLFLQSLCKKILQFLIFGDEFLRLFYYWMATDLPCEQMTFTYLNIML